MFKSKEVFAVTNILCLFLYSCASVPITGRSQLSIIPSSQLVSLSLNNYRKLISESKLSEDTQKVNMVKKVGYRLADATEAFLVASGRKDQLKYYAWEFNLIEDNDNKNAFAMPGGKIGVFTGLLPVTQNEIGLATVVSHEIAHTIANHGGERMSQYLIATLGGITLDQVLKEKSGRTRQLSMLAYGVSSSVGVLLPFSRLQEKEADRIGLVIMARAGYDPREALKFWERMSQLASNKVPEFLSTHPAHSTRIKAIQEALPEALGYYESK